MVSSVVNLLQGKWASLEIAPPLQPSEIAVIYPRLTEKLEKAFLDLKKRLEKEAKVPVVWLSDKEETLMPGRRLTNQESSFNHTLCQRAAIQGRNSDLGRPLANERKSCRRVSRKETHVP